jgi:hypothetical protein
VQRREREWENWKGRRENGQSRCSEKASLISFERFDSLPTNFVDPNLLHNPFD